MRRARNYQWLFVLIMGMCIFSSKIVEATSPLPAGMVVGDDQGIKVKSDGEYLIDIRDVEPGRKWVRRITLANLEKDTPYKLTMSVSAKTKAEGKLDLSEAIKMTIYYEGKEVYLGPLSGVSTAKNLQDPLNPLDLGFFRSGDSKMLEVHFELDGAKYKNSDFLEKNVVENIWHFTAVKTRLPDTKGGNVIDRFLPNTGEEWSQALLAICICLFLILIVLLIIKHKREEKST